MSFEEKNLPEYESRVYEVADEDSTIFSAPELHRDRVKRGRNLKRIIFSSVSLVLVAAIVAAVILLIPKKVVPPILETFDPYIFEQLAFEAMENGEFEKLEKQEDESDYAYNRRVVDAHFKSLTAATLTRGDTVIEFTYSEVEKKVTDDDGNNVTKKVMEWRLKDIDPSLTDYTIIDNTVSSFFEQHYTKKVSDDKNDGNNYGFDKPEYKVDFYRNGSDEIYLSLIIGAENPSKTGRYITTSKDNAVYFTAGVSEFYQYQKELTDFVQPESIPVISKPEDYSDSNYTNGQLIMCDKLILKGNTFGGEYVIETQEVDHVKTFTAYVVTSPTRRPGNDENIGNIVALFSYGVTADGCYSYTNTEEDIKKYGLDKPDFDVTIKVGSVEIGFKATKQDDGNYAVYYKGNRTIMKVSAGSLAPASYDRGDIFNRLLFIENITNAQSVKVESGASSVQFDVTTSHNEETDNDTLEGIKIGGVTVPKEDFQAYYQYLVSISAISYDEHDTKGMTPTTVITLTHKGGKTKTVVKYFQITTARYQVEVDGTKMGLISSSEHTRIMKYALNLANGKEYNAR